MVRVQLPLSHLSACLVLLAAVAMVFRCRRAFPVLLVVPVNPAVLGAVLSVAAVEEHHAAFGVVQGLEVAVGLAGALRCHLQVGPDAVVAGTFVVAEVNDAALVGAFVGRLDAREAELVRDVAAYDLHNLIKLKNKTKKTNRKHNRQH